ncbi:hypothetical protein LTR37_014577 [Vermiconidia calcicola]|uniref:Uncharacterized protein n=1 Tax=Vermiconidia calcicola TaxID=1690605 RepID=A0ACC3MT63_9PEZI|nr:hypothetical protein LTR37_014577 [Vermiconidia calcicola]
MADHQQEDDVDYGNHPLVDDGAQVQDTQITANDGANVPDVTLEDLQSSRATPTAEHIVNAAVKTLFEIAYESELLRDTVQEADAWNGMIYLSYLLIVNTDMSYANKDWELWLLLWLCKDDRYERFASMQEYFEQQSNGPVGIVLKQAKQELVQAGKLNGAAACVDLGVLAAIMASDDKELAEQRKAFANQVDLLVEHGIYSDAAELIQENYPFRLDGQSIQVRSEYGANQRRR